MITAEQVSKQFGHTIAVDDISFDVKEGENMIFLGTSGCGKTTTLKMINRLIPASKGQITVNGKNIAAQSPETLRRSIGYVLQHNSLFPHYTVAENIAVVPQLLKWDKRKIAERTEELVAKLHLSPRDYLQAYPHELSGGQQQRVNIARALAADPPILLMDEPFGALDAITRATICKEFSELDEFIKKTVVMVTHDVKEAFLLGDRICLMNDGKIVQQGKPLELLFHPANEFVKDFLSGSYLQLALTAIKVQDVWEDLVANGTGEQEEVILSANASLWEVLELSVKQKDKEFIQVENNTGAVKNINRNEVFKAFSLH